MPATANRIVKNTGFLYARMGITMFSSLWATRLVLNALGANDFGIFNVIGGAIGMLSFLNASMATATQRYLSFYQGAGNKDKCKDVFYASIILHFAISIILILCFLLSGWLFFNNLLNIPPDRVNAAYVVYGSLVVSTALTVMNVPYDAALNAHEDMRYYAIVGILESMLKLIVAFVVVYVLVDKLVVYGILMSGIPIVILIIMRMYCQKHYDECRISLQGPLNKELLKEMSTFAGWNFLTSLSSVFTQYGLGLVLNHFYGAILNAAQGIANQLSGMLMAFCNGMLKALNPVITKNTGAGNRQQAIMATLLGNKYSFVLLAVFAMPCLMEMPLVLKLWIKNIPDWCILFCQLQLVRSVVEQLFITLRTAISAQGQIKELSIVSSILNILPFILTYTLFSKGFPPYTMYIVWIFCYSICGGVTLVYYSKHLCDISYKMFIRVVLAPCLFISFAMILSGSISTFILPSSYLRILQTSALTTLGLAGALSLVMSKAERQYCLALIKRIL